MADQLVYTQVNTGMDPELFLTKQGSIIESGKVITEKKTSLSKVTSDGVQVEVNPSPNGCRIEMRNNLTTCFQQLQRKINQDKSLGVSFKQVTKLTKKQLQDTSDEGKRIGCAPSTNIYTRAQSKIKKVNPDTFGTRMAGGHLHFGQWGFPPSSTNSNPVATRQAQIDKAITTPEHTIPMLDIILGNTAVLIDKGSGARERRKMYGRAGEYRTPIHNNKPGLEYRTLSNFWLVSYPMMSLVTGLARVAFLIIAESLSGSPQLTNPTKEELITSKVNLKDIETAINENDQELAMKNFQLIKATLLNMTQTNPSLTLNKDNIKQFEFFVTKPLEYWFKDDPFKHWCNEGTNNIYWCCVSCNGPRDQWTPTINIMDTGWERFAELVINEDHEYQEVRKKERELKRLKEKEKKLA